MHWILTRVVLPLAILGGAGFGASKLVQSAEKASKDPPAAVAPLVDVITLSKANISARVIGSGIVEAEREVTLSAEVAGRLTKVSDDVVVGGRLKQGAFVAQIDGRTYDLAVRQQNSQVAAAQADLELEKGRGQVAEREWDLLAKDSPNRQRSALALRQPQREAAEVALESARASLDRAKYDRTRTRIVAPFNATVTRESIDIGAYMAPGAQIATLIGTDAFRVRVSLPIEDLALIDIPGLHGTEGSKATVVQDLGTRTIEREGTVIRLIGELDADSRTAQVLVEVKNPLDPPEGELPLLPGAFVRVEIDGKQTQDVAPVPRSALFDGNQVWVVAEDDTIAPRSLTVSWSDDETVYASDGVNDGERLLVTDLPTLINGMTVQVSSAANALAEAEPANGKEPASDAG